MHVGKKNEAFYMISYRIVSNIYCFKKYELEYTICIKIKPHTQKDIYIYAMCLVYFWKNIQKFNSGC